MTLARAAVALFGFVFLGSTAARADPADPAYPDESPRAGVAVGGMIGVDHHGFDAITVDGTYNVTGSFWAHAIVAVGDTSTYSLNHVPDEASYSGRYFAARAGVEEHLCSRAGFCAFGGIDVGYRSLEFGIEGEGASPPDDSYASVVAVPRIGLDVGARHFRFRPEIDLNVGPDGVHGAEVNLPLAYRW